MTRQTKGRAGLVSLLAAEAISAAGTKMSILAVPWFVLVTTGSPTKMGLVGLFQTLPYVLSGIFATPLVDRLGMRRVSILHDVFSAALVAGIALFARLDFMFLLGLAALIGTVQGVGDRAKRVLLQPIAEQAGASMPRVVAIYAGIDRINLAVSVALGGLVIAWIGPIGAIWVNAASHVICAAMVSILVRLPARAKKEEKQQPETYITALKGGYSFLRRDRLLVSIISMLFMTNLFNQASAAVLIPLWVMREFNSPVALGWVTGSLALGGIIGNLALIGLINRLPRYLTFVTGYLIGGAPRFLALGLTDDLAVILGVSFIGGIASASINPAYGALLYERVPKKLQARVFGLTGAFVFGGIPLGGLAGAWFVQGLDLTRALLLTGALYFCVTLAPIIGYRTWKQMDDDPAEKRQSPPALPVWVESLGTLSQRVLPTGMTGLERKPVSVHLKYADHEWQVVFKSTRKPLRSNDVLHAVKVLDIPEVYETVEQIHAADLARIQARQRDLRAELTRLENVIDRPARTD